MLKLVPRVGGKRWQYYIFGPLALISVGPFILAYKLFFGWWLSPMLDRQFKRKLRQQVRTDFSFLFEEVNARFVKNDRAYKNEIVVTVEASDLRITVSQHHGDYGISVANREIPHNRESLVSILKVIYEREGSLRKPLFLNLAEIGELFRDKFKEVRTSLSRDDYPETAAAISRSHLLGMEATAQAFNRSGGYFEATLVNPNDLIDKPSK